MRKLSLDHEIQTERLVLRFPHHDEVDFVWDATRYPRFNDGMLWDKPESKDGLDVRFSSNVADWENGSSYLFSLRTLNTNEPVGRIVIASASCGWNVGFWTHPKYQGAGYMTEALIAVVGFGFDVLNLESIEACHADWNLASRRVLEKCGFSFNRHVEQGFQKNGKWVPQDVLSIQREQRVNESLK